MRVIISAVLLAALSLILVHHLRAPFPSPHVVLQTPYETLVHELGPPADFDPNSKLPIPIRSAKSVAWIKPRAIAHWTLQIDYRSTAFGPQARPDGVSECLETRWVWIDWLLPCEAICMARVVVG